MRICKNCIHYNVCEYSTIADKEVDCKDFLSKTLKSDTVRKMQRLFEERLDISADGYYSTEEVKLDCFETLERIAEEILEENNG